MRPSLCSRAGLDLRGLELLDEADGQTDKTHLRYARKDVRHARLIHSSLRTFELCILAPRRIRMLTAVHRGARACTRSPLTAVHNWITILSVEGTTRALQALCS